MEDLKTRATDPTISRVATLALMAGNGAALITTANLLVPPIIAGDVQPSIGLAVFALPPAIGLLFSFVAMQWAHREDGDRRARQFWSVSQTALILSVVFFLAFLAGFNRHPFAPTIDAPGAAPTAPASAPSAQP